MAEQLNRFNDVQPKRLRVFNRVVVAFNLVDDFGKAALEDYLEDFSSLEQLEMQVMSAYIQKHGPEKVRKEVINGINFKDDGDNSIQAMPVADPT